ncbi:MAG: DUF5615 family PIN-like protein [Paracoccaceae bacterium]
MNKDPQPQQSPGLRLDPELVAQPDLVIQRLPEAERAFAPPLFRFLTDHNVPDSVGRVLADLGQDVVRLRDVMAVDTTDPVVARAAIEGNRVLVSWDRDFNQQRFHSPRFAGLSRLSMSGPEMEGAVRHEAVFDVIMFALNRAVGAPITIRVGVGKIQIHV